MRVKLAAQDPHQKTVMLTPEQLSARLAMGCCPACASRGHITARLRKRPGKVLENSETGRVTLSGWFYECPEYGWEHYQLSPGDAKTKPRETAGLRLPGTPSREGSPRVIRRRLSPR
ncbi:MAG: hypothetical protein EB145_15305 [Proteobacteria bacterium]|nr:hypothetical protein [Pseudomonadota bacterium]